jgi:hypothetical protein
VSHGYPLSGGQFASIDFPGVDSSFARGINDRGDIVGLYRSGGVTHGYLLSEGKSATIDFPGASFTSGLEINPRGDIVSGCPSIRTDDDRAAAIGPTVKAPTLYVLITSSWPVSWALTRARLP